MLLLCALTALFGAWPPACPAGAELQVKHVFRSPSGLPTIEQHARNIPVVRRADVVVAGGGVAGVTAALQAAAEGMSVAIIEERNYFGYELAGPQTYTTDPYRPASSCPMAEKVYRRLAENRAVSKQRLSPTKLKQAFHGMVRGEPRIIPYLYSLPAGVVMEGGAVRGVVMVNRSGRQIVLAKAVIDATGDARLAAAAGAEFARPLAGQKTVRRFITVSKANPLKPGKLEPPDELGLLRASVVSLGREHQVVELALRATLGGNVGRDLSRAQASTLEKAVALLDHLDKTPAAFQSGKIDPERPLREHIRPGPEILIDEPPVVACRSQRDSEKFKPADLKNPETCLPRGIKNLVIAGRTVSAAREASGLQALLASGEQAGRTAVEIARKTHGFTETQAGKTRAGQASPGRHVREILGGPDRTASYPVVRQGSAALPVVERDVDVLVVGGGTSGGPAAIAAARQGAKVVLLEFLPNLGGTATNRVTGYYWGVTWRSQLTQELDRMSRMYLRVREKNRFSGEEKKIALQQLAQAAGVTIYYQTLGAGVVMEGNKVVGVVFENAGGRQVILAKMVIDATGHGDIAAAAGAQFTTGRHSDRFMHEVDRNGLRDPMNIEDITRFTMKRPSQSIALNVRESRHIIGDYMLSFDDTLHGRNFPDLVCKWRSNYDTHFPSSANQSRLAQDWVALLGLWRRPIVGNIPYRCLLVKGIENLLVVAKSFSADHDTNIGARMQRDLQHLGEAGGVAAAMAARLGTTARNVPLDKLQQELVRIGVLRQEDLDTLSAGQPDFDPAAAAKLLGTDRGLDAMTDLYLAGQRSIPALKPLLASADPNVRADAALVLGILGDRSAIPALLEFLKQKNSRTHTYRIPECSSRTSVPLYWASVVLLGRLEVKEAAGPIADLLEDPEKCPPDLASFAITALANIGDPAAVAAIKPYLNVGRAAPMDNENKSFELKWGVRTNAARALARLGDPSGVPVLIGFLEEDQSLVRDYAERLLEEITGKHFGKDRARWEKWWKEQH